MSVIHVLKNTGRVPPSDIAKRVEEFTTPAREGDKFGKSWDTHWFKLKLTLPDDWLAEDKEVHLIWNSGCEASLFTLDGSKLL